MKNLITRFHAGLLQPVIETQNHISRISDDEMRDVLAQVKKISSPSARQRAVTRFEEFISPTKLGQSTTYDASKKATQAFLRVANAIDDPELFWMLAGEMWGFDGDASEPWSELFSEPKFIRYPLQKRVQLCNPRSFHDLYLQQLIKKIKQKGKVKVYRVFHVGDHSIRSAGTKNDPDFFKQAEGLGFSYSLSKTVTFRLSHALLKDEIGKRYGKDNAAEGFRKKLLFSLGENQDYLEDFARKRPYIGIYEVKAEDILTILFMRSEEEIVTKRAKLIRYEPITFLSQISGLLNWKVAMTLAQTVESEQGIPVFPTFSSMPEITILKTIERSIRRKFSTAELKDLYPKVLDLNYSDIYEDMNNDLIARYWEVFAENFDCAFVECLSARKFKFANLKFCRKAAA